MMNQIRDMMDKQDNIRNISVIAHVDHGKTTLVDSLLSKAGLIREKNAGRQTLMDTRDDEQERGITIKSASVSLNLQRFEQTEVKEEIIKQKVPYLINLIDSPGHVDFSSEVTAALRITDGAICVVDCIEGVCTQTETVLRQAILERVKPVLFLNKLDRIFLEQNLDLSEAYKLFKNTIESINVICETYKDPNLGQIKVDPRKGNVAFGSGYFSWGFTLSDFAKVYSAQFGVGHRKMMKYLWGKNYWNPKTQEWIKTDLNGKLLNGFCEFILKPIQVFHHSIKDDNKNIYEPLFNALSLGINNKDISECDGYKELLRLSMGRWLPAGNAMLDLVADHLPSPKVAQKYRIPLLYTGPLDTEEAQSMINCDRNGPLSVYISKMIPVSNDSGRFIAFGRVFSGTIKRGQELRILGPQYTHFDADNDEMKQNDDNKNKKKSTDLYRKKVQGILMMMGKSTEKISECPAGNCCGLMGLDSYLVKSGTLTNNKNIYPFKTMKFSVSAVVKQAVDVVYAKDLPKLVEGLKKLDKVDPLLTISTDKQGQKIIAGAGELHLEICLKDLQEIYMKNAPIKISNPIVSFCESIGGNCGSTIINPPSFNNKQQQYKYPNVMIGKSPNKLNRLYMTAEPLSNDVIDAIDDGSLQLKYSDMKLFGRTFSERFLNNSISKEDATRIWTFGCPPDNKCNILIDQTRGVQYVQDIRDSIVNGFMQFTSGGILCDESLRGVRFDVVDCKIHTDPVHRGPGQIIPAAMKCFNAALLSSNPILLEPMYRVEIDVPIDSQNGVFKTLGKVRGEMEKCTDRMDVGIPLAKIIAFVPIIETFADKKIKKDGFTELLRKNTKGKAFPVMTFSHWKEVSGNPLKENSTAYNIMMKTRERKGMKLEIPDFTDYYDKM